MVLVSRSVNISVDGVKSLSLLILAASQLCLQVLLEIFHYPGLALLSLSYFLRVQPRPVSLGLFSNLPNLWQLHELAHSLLKCALAAAFAFVALFSGLPALEELSLPGPFVVELAW